MTDKYAGTKGLTERIALNRIYELMETQALGSKDQEFYEEAKAVLEAEFDKKLESATNWAKVKGKLSAKQLLFVLEGED